MAEDIESVVKETLRGHSSLEDLADILKDEVRLEPMKGSCLNHVYRVFSSDELKSCIVKVYRSYAKEYGPDAPLEPERCRREQEAIEYFNSIVPLCCPRVFFQDQTSNMVCLQDMRDFGTWGEYLLKSCDLQAGAKLADTMVTLHTSSHRLKIGEGEFEQLQQKFRSFPQQTHFLCDAHFTKPFSEGNEAKGISDQTVQEKLSEVKADAAVIKALTLAKEWMAVGAGDCCIHGDLHAGSLLFNGKEDIKLIDLECARVGPPAFDVALLVCNYVLLYHYHQQKAQPNEDEEDDGLNHNYVRRHILDLICITLSRYMEGMGRILGDSFDHHQAWKQVLLFLGVEIISWVSGPPCITELNALPGAQLNCLNTALRILHKQSLSLDTRDLSCLINS